MFNNLNSGWNALSYKAKDGSTLLYQLHIPEKYSEEKKYPLILYMHGAGSRCSDNSHIYAPHAKFLRNFESGAYKNEALMLAPCCPKDGSWVQNRERTQTTLNFTLAPTVQMQAVIELLELVQSDLSVDTKRLYLQGNSMGAHATWELLSRFPGRFAAAIPAAGAGDTNFASKLKDTPVWIFHGTADTIVPYECSVLMYEALRKAGSTEVLFTDLDGLGHGIWPAMADTEGLYEWLFSQHLKG